MACMRGLAFVILVLAIVGAAWGGQTVLDRGAGPDPDALIQCVDGSIHLVRGGCPLVVPVSLGSLPATPPVVSVEQ